MDLLQNTRDMVIALHTEFGGMKQRVERNSEILEELHRAHLKQATQVQTGWRIGTAIVSAGRYVVTGLSGGGLVWLMQHFPVRHAG